MKKVFCFYIVLLVTITSFAQSTIPVYPGDAAYRQSLHEFRNNYVQTHEVVKGDDRKNFRFFKPDKKYYTVADFKKSQDTTGFLMKTSGSKTPKFYKYGTVTFKIGKLNHTLTVYQGEDTKNSIEYADYLFVPYTDLTSGEESYGGGKYIEFFVKDIINGKVVIDFNKAYNPYCAYTTGYNCPLPPRENHLNVAVKAGEMQFAGH